MYLLGHSLIGSFCGYKAGCNNGSCSLNNCTNNGSIEGNNSGGICSNNAANNNGSCEVNNCVNNYFVVNN